MLLVGLLCGGFAVDVAVRGAEASVPAAGDAGVVEGTLLLPAEGERALMRSPVGDPFIYAEVRLADQPGRNAPHWSGAFGDASVRVQTAEGPVETQLAPPGEWRVLPGQRERREGIVNLASLPIVREVETDERLNPPFYLDVTAVRPGDHVIVERGPDGTALRTYVGEREAHERAHASREDMRWPMVGLLFILAVVSVLGGHRLLTQRLNKQDQAAQEDDAST